MTTTTRICLDMLTSARARREEYVGPWLPWPVVDAEMLAPDSRTELVACLSHCVTWIRRLGSVYVQRNGLADLA